MSGQPLRIAIACSGLGHIRRGNEAWARDASAALHAAGVDVTLFGGGPRPEAGCPYVRLPSIPRELFLLRRWVPWSRRYLIEQLSFLPALRRELRRRNLRCVHLCDPDLALQLHRRTTGLQVAFKDGMLLGPHWCRRMPFVHVLAPYYRDVLAREAGVDTSRWFVIPHLVDTREFQPAADRRVARGAWPDLNLSPDDFVVLGIGDYSDGGRKRLDWLVRELASLPSGLNARLVLAGQANETEFARFQRFAAGMLGPRVRLLRNLSRQEIARLHQLADVFAHAATREPFGIVFLEAMSSGTPVVAHDWEVTRWIVGDAGVTLDMTRAGELASRLERWAREPASLAPLRERARQRALSTFAPPAIVPCYLEMYESMAGALRES